MRDPFSGTLIDGRYRIQTRIARGGMATVYLAQDERLDRAVAIKVLHPHLAEGQEFIDRFRREARAAAKLVHPGIVAVYDQGTWGDSPYLVMELVEGSNLRHVLETAGLPPVGKALDLIAQVLDALALAHNAGFVHRDIKPENILISSTGQIKVADFGLARAVSEVTAASSGVVLGTVAYLSPELVAEGVADTRADVYAVGVVLFELLTGRQPFIGEAPIQVAFQHVHAPFPVPSSIVPWLPGPVDQLIAQLTAKNPDDRPADAAAALSLVRQLNKSLPDEVAGRRAAGPPRPLTPAEAASAGVYLQVDAEALAELKKVASKGKGPGGDQVAGQPPGYSTGGTQALPLAIVPPGGPDREKRADQPVAPTSTPPKKRRVGIVWRFLIALLIIGLLAGGGALLWYNQAGPGSLVTVPRLVGLDLTAAQAELVRLELTYSTSPIYSDSSPAGTVLQITPVAETQVPKQTEVTLVVSRGIEQKTVPTEGLVGVQAEAAKAALVLAGLDGEVTLDPVFSSEVDQGVVLEVDPPGGREVPHNQAFTLTVSKGPEPVQVPSLEGLTLEEAQFKAEPFDLTVVQGDEEAFETVAEGLIIRQNPGPGANLHRGDEVSVVISTGLPFYEVPNVLQKTYAEAEAELRRLGFEVTREVLGTGLLDRVQQQTPEAGSWQRKGTTIRLVTV